MDKEKTIKIVSLKHGVINEVSEYEGKLKIESGEYKEYKKPVTRKAKVNVE